MTPALVVPITSRATRIRPSMPMPLRVCYDAETVRGREVRVFATYDSGVADSVGPVCPYADVRRIVDRDTGDVLLDGCLVRDEVEGGLSEHEREEIEAHALDACALAVEAAADAPGLS